MATKCEFDTYNKIHYLNDVPNRLLGDGLVDVDNQVCYKAMYPSDRWGNPYATVRCTVPANPGGVDTAFVHYLLAGENVYSSWLKAAADYIKQFRPSLGSQVAEAVQYQHVTILGSAYDPDNPDPSLERLEKEGRLVPLEADQILQNNGVKVNRIKGATTAAIEEILRARIENDDPYGEKD